MSTVSSMRQVALRRVWPFPTLRRSRTECASSPPPPPPPPPQESLRIFARARGGGQCVSLCVHVRTARGGRERWQPARVHACVRVFARAGVLMLLRGACMLACVRTQSVCAFEVHSGCLAHALAVWQLHCALAILANLLRDPEGASASALTALRRISLFRLHLSPSPLPSVCGRAPPASHTAARPTDSIVTRPHNPTLPGPQDARARIPCLSKPGRSPTIPCVRKPGRPPTSAPVRRLK